MKNNNSAATFFEKHFYRQTHTINVAFLLLLCIALALLLSGCSGGHDDSNPETMEPAVSLFGPITEGSHGFPATPAVADLDGAGYVEEEFFMEGTAQAYAEQGEWTIDGIWSVSEASLAEYKTRLLVRRPQDPGKFSGVVIVEWFNVTSGIDIDVDFGYLSEEILRAGHAWVGVTAQAIAIDSNGGGSFGPGAVGLAIWDPLRYDTLHHPGDSYSYDIFSQAGASLRSPVVVDALDGLSPRIMLAAGQSQSAMRMLTYYNAIHTEAAVYDGFLIHNRAGTGAALGEGFSSLLARLRTDLEAPVFQVVTETEMFELAGAEFSFTLARQPNSGTVHTWEIAGAAHADAHYLTTLMAQGNIQFEDFLDLSAVLPLVNSAPQHLAMNAALDSLVKWVEEGIAPAAAMPIQTTSDAISRDANGNALGGLRLPHVNAPVALQTGEDGIPFSGKTEVFDSATLEALYPDADAYVKAVSVAAQAAVDAGHLLPIDATRLIDEALASPPVN